MLISRSKTWGKFYFCFCSVINTYNFKSRERKQQSNYNN